MESVGQNPHSVIVVDVKNGSEGAGGEEEEDVPSTAAGDCAGACRLSSASECSVEVDPAEIKVLVSKSEKDCRICHMNLDLPSLESGVPIELGCSCKGDLAAAHKHCAETWFKIKGNKICEVCGSVAVNISGPTEAEPGEHWTESDPTAQQEPAVGVAAEARNFWQGHRFLNFLLACMVFAFVISWLFHFNVPS